MKSGRRTQRAAFTLLEMMLAMAIGVLLMIGLYVALNTHLNATSSGRVRVAQAQVSGHVLDLVSTDVMDHLATIDLYPPTAKAAAAAAAAATAGTATAPAGPYVFNLGLQGGTNWLCLQISKVALAEGQATPTSVLGAENQSIDCDLRRITYFLAPPGGSDGGLARQELGGGLSAVLPIDSTYTMLPPGNVDDMTKIVAPEVIAVQFQFWDGNTWYDNWDGTILSADGITPVGPPLSIAITLSVAQPDNLSVDPSDPTVQQFKHVIDIPTASFFNNQQQPATTTTTPSTTTTTGGSTP